MIDDDVFASRRLTFTPTGGRPEVLDVRIGRPFSFPGVAPFWRVNIEIRGASEAVHERVTADDSAQCLDIALDVIGDSFLARWLQRGEVTWNGLHHGFGSDRRERAKEQLKGGGGD